MQGSGESTKEVSGETQATSKQLSLLLECSYHVLECFITAKSENYFWYAHVHIPDKWIALFVYSDWLTGR